MTFLETVSLTTIVVVGVSCFVCGYFCARSVYPKALIEEIKAFKRMKDDEVARQIEAQLSGIM